VGQKFPRIVYRDVIRGKLYDMCTFSAEQLEAIIALCDAFTGAGIIERSVPRPLGLSQDLTDVPLQNTIPGSERRNLHGVYGHFHLSSKKWDPGINIFRELIKVGY
jgi:hypothetical protein